MWFEAGGYLMRIDEVFTRAEEICFFPFLFSERSSVAFDARLVVCNLSL